MRLRGAIKVWGVEKKPEINKRPPYIKHPRVNMESAQSGKSPCMTSSLQKFSSGLHGFSR